MKDEIKDRFKNLKTITVNESTISYKDVFLLKQIYTILHEWLIEEDYASRNDEDFQEVCYIERKNPTAGDELWIRWRLSKSPDSKLYKYLLDIDFHILTMKEVELAHKGKKYKANKGELEIQIAARLQLDPEETIENSPLFKKFKDYYFQRLYKSRLAQHKNQLLHDSQRLQEAIKTYLKLETYFPEKEFGELHAKATPD